MAAENSQATPAAAPSLTPQERLAQSRRAIARQLSRGREEDDPGAPAGDDASPSVGSSGLSGSVWSLARQALGDWWAHHPAHAAAALAAPVVGNYARTRPWQVLGLAAGAGAALVLTRSWRRAWFGRAVGNALGSAEMSGLLISLLHNQSNKDHR